MKGFSYIFRHFGHGKLRRDENLRSDDYLRPDENLHSDENLPTGNIRPHLGIHTRDLRLGEWENIPV